MRLIEADSLSMCLDEAQEHLIGPYAILSHTWDPGEDQVFFSDFSSNDIEEEARLRYGPARQWSGFRKLRSFARVAQDHRCPHIWIDSCCINKDNSTELQESLNSMYRWYERSTVCIIYLSDFELEMRDKFRPEPWEQRFKSCRWFHRGWTLQELIAPKARAFYDRHWRRIDAEYGPISKATINLLIHQKTGIPLAVLEGTASLADINIASKMRWAASRDTTREEDVAYSLMGLFDVQMTLQYGEGREKAFIRLQRKILKQTGDQSIFAWAAPHLRPHHRLGLLAPAPEFFDIPSVEHNDWRVHELGESHDLSIWAVTNQGLRLSLHVYSEEGDSPVKLRAYLGIMNRKTEMMPTLELHQLGGSKYQRGPTLEYRNAPEALKTEKRELMVPLSSAPTQSTPPIAILLRPTTATELPVNIDLQNHLDCEWVQKPNVDGLHQVVCRHPREEGGFYVASAKIEVTSQPRGEDDSIDAAVEDIAFTLYQHCWLRWIPRARSWSLWCEISSEESRTPPAPARLREFDTAPTPSPTFARSQVDNYQMVAESVDLHPWTTGLIRIWASVHDAARFRVNASAPPTPALKSPLPQLTSSTLKRQPKDIGQDSTNRHFPSCKSDRGLARSRTREAMHVQIAPRSGTRSQNVSRSRGRRSPSPGARPHGWRPVIRWQSPEAPSRAPGSVGSSVSEDSQEFTEEEGPLPLVRPSVSFEIPEATAAGVRGPRVSSVAESTRDQDGYFATGGHK